MVEAKKQVCPRCGGVIPASRGRTAVYCSPGCYEGRKRERGRGYHAERKERERDEGVDEIALGYTTGRIGPPPEMML